MLIPSIICLCCCLVASLSHTAIISLLFRDWFSISSDVYERLGQFDYDQPHCTTDHITTCIEDKDNGWIYIGEVKEKGTDHIPHGIGIQVWADGGTQQLNYKV